KTAAAGENGRNRAARWQDMGIERQRRAMQAAFAAFGRAHPEQAALAEEFARLLDDPADPFVRGRLAGHFTASAWLVDRSGRRALLTHHRKLGAWLQPGGHADGDRDL